MSEVQHNELPIKIDEVTKSLPVKRSLEEGEPVSSVQKPDTPEAHRSRYGSPRSLKDCSCWPIDLQVRTEQQYRSQGTYKKA